MRNPSDEDCAKGTRDGSQALSHRLASAGVYFVTARTGGKCIIMHRKLHSLTTKELNRRDAQ